MRFIGREARPWFGGVISVVAGAAVLLVMLSAPSLKYAAVECVNTALAYPEKPALYIRNIVKLSGNWVLERATLNERVERLELERQALAEALQRAGEAPAAPRESYVREDVLDARIRLTNYAHSLRLTPFVRVSHYLRDNFGPSTNVEVGARFTFPLYGDASAKRRALRTEQAITSLGRESLCETLTEQCRRLINQLERLNVALDAEQRHADLLRRFIALRTQAYMNSQNGYNHVARLEEYNEYLKSLERTYSLLRLRDLCLLDIQKAAGYPDMSSMIQIKEASL